MPHKELIKNTLEEKKQKLETLKAEKSDNEIEEQKAEQERENKIRNENLIKWGLYIKEYYNTEVEDGMHYDKKEEKYYKKIPLHVPDEEYEKLLDLHKQIEHHEYEKSKSALYNRAKRDSDVSVGPLFFGIAIFTFILAFITGIVFIISTSSFTLLIPIWGGGAILGLVFIAIAEMLKILHKIDQKSDYNE